MYSGDEELSDQEQSPELAEYDDEEFDHEFEPDEDEEGNETDECEICGESEGSPIHQDQS